MKTFKVANRFFPPIETWLFKNGSNGTWATKPDYQVYEHAYQLVNIIEIDDDQMADRFQMIWSKYLIG